MSAMSQMIKCTLDKLIITLSVGQCVDELLKSLSWSSNDGIIDLILQFQLSIYIKRWSDLVFRIEDYKVELFYPKVYC